MHWKLSPDVTIDYPLDDLALHADGFVYCIKTPSGKLYIGKKWTHAKRKRDIIESDWKRYVSSCKQIKDDIKANGKAGYEFVIICICETRSETNYREVQYQFVHDVLNTRTPDGERLYINGNIASRWFVAPEHHSPETRQRMSMAKRMMTTETRKRMSAAKTGKPLSDEHKRRISETQRKRLAAKKDK